MSISLDLKLNEQIDDMIRKLEAAKREGNFQKRIQAVRKIGLFAQDWYTHWDEKLSHEPAE
jgi:hypothetical protein